MEVERLILFDRTSYIVMATSAMKRKVDQSLYGKRYNIRSTLLSGTGTRLVYWTTKILFIYH